MSSKAKALKHVRSSLTIVLDLFATISRRLLVSDFRIAFVDHVVADVEND